MRERETSSYIIRIMWPSSNMFLKKLITNLCIFPRSSSSSQNKNKSPSFSTHLSRHLYTQPVVHNDPFHSTDQNSHSDKMMSTMTMMIKNNLNNTTLDASTSKSTSPDYDDDDDVFFTSSSNSDHLISEHDNQNQQPDFATAFASQRFFFSSPGHSKSLISTKTAPPQLQNIKNNNSGPLLQTTGGVPVPKYSPDPYWDFRKSMQEMVDARWKDENDAAENWEYLHQLLTCYLTLNPINTHECIIKAFSDLLVNCLLNNKHTDMNRFASSSAKRSDDRSRSISRRLL